MKIFVLENCKYKKHSSLIENKFLNKDRKQSLNQGQNKTNKIFNYFHYATKKLQN